MLSSIHPLGERSKGNRWWLTVTAFVIGSTAGGTLAGALAGLLGTALARAIRVGSGWSAVIVVLVVVSTLLFDLKVVGFRLPTVRRQVNEDWLNRYRGWVYGFGYGLQLGFGVITVVTTASVYAALVLAVLTGSLMAGALIGSAFGLLRGLAILPGRTVTSPGRLRDLHHVLARGGTLASTVTVVGEVLVILLAGSTILAR